MIGTMSGLSKDNQINVRSLPAIKLGLDRVASELRAAGRLRVGRDRMNRELLANVLFLWLADRDLAAVEAALGPYAARLATLLAENPAGAVLEAPAVIIENRPAPKPRRGGRTG